MDPSPLTILCEWSHILIDQILTKHIVMMRYKNLGVSRKRLLCVIGKKSFKTTYE